METVITTQSGVELTVRGNPRFEKDYRGSQWVCETVEVQNPVTKSWHPIMNENVGYEAEQALCERAETYNPYIEGDLEPPARYL